MKKTFIMLMVALFASTTICMAQDNQDRRQGRRGMDPKARVENMIKELGLNETTAAQFRVVMEEQQKQMMEDMSSIMGQLEEGQRPTAEQRQQMMEKFQEKQAAINTVLQIILTEDQFKKYQEMNTRRGPGRNGGDRMRQGREE